MSLSEILDRVCEDYFTGCTGFGSLIGGYDVSPRGTSLCFIHEDLSVEFHNIFSDTPPKKIPKTRAPGSIPYIPAEQVHDYVLDGIASVTACKRPSVIVHEEYAFGAKGNAVLDIAELGQDVRRLLRCSPFEYHMQNLMSLKSFVKQTCNGKEIKKALTKEQMVSLLSARFGIYFTDNNEADAFALAFWGISSILNHKELKISHVTRTLYTPEVFQQSAAR